jgi:hypothetical protein
MTLIELLTAMILAILLLIMIGTLYSDTIKLYKKADFSQLAQKMAGVILESMAREIRGAVRIEPEYNNVIRFPIDRTLFPLAKDGGSRDGGAAATSMGKHYITFTDDASPVNQVDLTYQFKKCDPSLANQGCPNGLPAIYYYGRTLSMGERFSPKTDAQLVPDPPTSAADRDACVRRYASDVKIIIENFEVWRSPDGVVLRVQLTDATFCNDRDWENDAGGDPDKFPRRPVVESSTFIAIRFYN